MAGKRGDFGMKHGFALACIAALAACSPQSELTGVVQAEEVAVADDGVHAEFGLPVIPLSVTSEGGKHSFKVEVASTPEEQAKGLMFRTTLGADEGMIFPYDGKKPASFWMKNTPLPLDIIFVGPDHRITNIANAEPYSLTPLPSQGPVLGVLELRGGRAEELGIKPGDLVEW